MRAGDPEQHDHHAEIAHVLRTFFSAFTSGPDVAERLTDLHDLFLPGATIVIAGDTPTVLDVDRFITPRLALLTDGRLSHFHEWEESGHTEVSGSIAHHWCTYAKAGEQEGLAFTGRGHKTVQLVRTTDGWRISALAWEDEQP
ncbi:hypothetical protein GCM10022415_27310 [Knoellia locipacati]|uniref:DUF4440 domain-containing protein n=1 Tax=Knoellia locipacati TaxID=882824 RepID=A0A512T3L4_9MICO|nr:DUF4440 domain-containing protein [Knoellia locipacati]GEQ14681.1 hypothetical protein KLO01_27280 [Knoellia locipacati]